jgi:Leucine-rich repeat (LRR) protein
MKKKLLILLFLASLTTYAQYTTIPDQNFEHKLISLGIDSGAVDGKVLTNNVNKLTSLDVSFSSITDLTGIQDFVALKEFRCPYNQISTLDVSKNVALTTLECFGNKLTFLDLSQNISLTVLTCYKNGLQTLDISKNLALTVLECGNNQITSLDVSKNVTLKTLDCSYNQITTLDVSKNVALATLYCFENNLTVLDVSKNLILGLLWSGSNPITTLDLSYNVTLTSLNCNGNSLTRLNLKNGKNYLLAKNVDFRNNPFLSCIQVDDITFANTNWLTNKDVTAYYSSLDCALATQIPDLKFEDKLIALNIDTDGRNGAVLTSSINTLKALNVSNSGITNLSGIAAFAQLETLNCAGNSYIKLDFSKNFTLKTIDVSKNANLESVDLRNGKNTVLTTVDFKSNPVLRCIQVDDVAYANTTWSNFKDSYTSFSTDCTIYTLIPDAKFEAKLIALGIDKDGVNGKVATERIATLTSLDVAYSSISDLTGIQDFVALKDFRCAYNQIPTLDISKNVALTSLDCYGNILTVLDVSKNLNLNELRCGSNRLNALDVSKNTALTTLYCNDNKLTILDVSKNMILSLLICSSNQITTLDVSKNVALTTFYCESNKLTSVNLKNGTNNLLSYLAVNFIYNPTLACIQVDDISYANANWSSSKDKTATFNTVCISYTLIPDAMFEDKLIALNIDTDGKNGVVLTSSINTLKELNVSNAGITNLSGIADFAQLEALNCAGNSYSKLDFSKNFTLKTIDVSKNVNLESIDLRNGKNTVLTTVDFKSNPVLRCIQVDDVAYATTTWSNFKDSFTSFNTDCTIYTLIPDVKFEAKLIALGIDKDGMNGKVATERIATLTSLDVSYSSISDLTGIQDFVALTTLNCYNNQITTLDVSKNVALTSLYCYYNQITTINVSKNVALTYLYCNNNKLTALDVSKNLILKELRCGANQITTLDISKNVALKYLYCFFNKLTALDVSKNLALDSLYCGSNQISTLDVSKNLALWFLNCNNNKLTLLDLSKNLTLSYLNCEFNQLSSLDVSNNVALNSIYCNTNKLTVLDVSKNLILDHLDCNSNQITTLDVSNNVALTYLYCYNNKLTVLDVSKNLRLNSLNCKLNQITALDVSNNVALTYIYCNSNKLTSLNLKNGKNNFLIDGGYVDFRDNPTLACIQVDDLAYANALWANSKDKTANYSTNCNPYTLIPDLNFENKLISLGIDSGVTDGKVLTNSIDKLTSLDVSSSSIADLTGIQDFVALQSLDCQKNNLTSLDLSKTGNLIAVNCTSNQLTNFINTNNLGLTHLYCSSNQLTSLDITKYTALTNLSFSSNKIASIDVSSNNLLVKLWCNSNLLSELNITNNTSLIELNCATNQITNLNVTKNTSLTKLYCFSNEITSLDVSQNIQLEWLMCHFNQLTSVDVSNNPKLDLLNCLNNKITSLDISKNPLITELACENNQLTYLNLKNGTNTILDMTYSNFANNPNLKCIQVDDVNYSNANWSNIKDSKSEYNTYCSPYTLIPDENFEEKLIALGIDSGETDGKVLTSSIVSITELNISYSSIKDLTGIQDFASLSTLDCSLNQLPTIDVSKNLALKSIDLRNNYLTKLDVSNNIALTFLNVGANKLTKLDVTNNLILETLFFHFNEFTSINLTKNLALKYLLCSSNQLTTIDVVNNVALSSLNCSSNQLTSIHLSKNIALSSLSCSSNQLVTLDLSKNVALSSISCSNNKLISLDLRNGNNKFITNTNYDFTKNPSLSCIQVDNAVFSNANWAAKKDDTTGYSNLDCSLVTPIPDTNFEDKLISLGIDTDGKNGAVLNSSIETITSLDISNASIIDLTGIQGFTGLNVLNCSSNQLIGLDLSKNIALTSLNCSDNKLLSLNLKNGKNTLFNTTALDFSKNASLTCIQVDDTDYSNKNWSDKKDATASYNIDCTSYILIPDTNFEDKLIALEIDKDGKNGKVATSSVNSVTYLDVSGSNIADMTGIQDFVALTYLDCNINNIKTIDVSNNKLLTKLALYNNQLTNLDVTKNTQLINLECSNNQIHSIDLSQNTKLLFLSIGDNQLSSLDISANVDLQSLYCTRNNLASLDLKKQTALLALECGYNNTTALDLSTNAKLESLGCYNMQLTALDLTANVLLKRLSAGSNQLTTMDLSKNNKLELVFLEFNPLTSLNLQNGNNKNFILPSVTGKTATNLYCSFANNSKLGCIKVDDEAFSNANWSKIKDATATYSATCSALGIEDSVFDKVVIFPNPTKGELHIDNIVLEKATVYDALGKLVKTTTFTSGTKDNTIHLDGFPSGIYYIYLESEGANTAKKIIVK